MNYRKVPGVKQSVDNFDYVNKAALFEGENNLRGYNRSQVRAFAQYFGIEPKADEESLLQFSNQVLDFGAGTGSLAEIFREEYLINPLCLEIDPILAKVILSKGFKVVSSLNQITANISLVYTSNVLEHIENDFRTLIDITKRLTRDAKIAIYVPALPFLFSDLDRKAGHYRRYRKNELIRKVSDAGFKVDSCFYSDSLGIPASILLKLLGYRDKTKLGSGKSLLLYDRIIYPVSQLLDSLGFKYLCGKNLFLFGHVNTKN
jgi:hypothetical protein